MVNFNPDTWEGTYRPPQWKDIRWRVFLLLASYLVLGFTLLGFSRQPLHVILLILSGAAMDMLLSGVLRSRKVFPLSAIISCCSLALLLNWSFGMHNLWLPVFICIASKYLITFRGRHFFNPSLFAIVISILLGEEYVTLAPAYQWYGTAETAWLMAFFIITGALFLFVFKINRGWLIGSFLITFFLQTVLRAFIMEHIIPWETLFLSSVTTPAFYLFTFYMITDPATSPNTKSSQILVGVSIALLDLAFHLKFSLYTFFFAGLTVAAARYIYLWIRELLSNPGSINKKTLQTNGIHIGMLFLLFVPVFWAFQRNSTKGHIRNEDMFEIERISSTHSGLGWRKSEILKETDPRLAHVAKWILSVGDAVAVSDINKDGLPDLFLTQVLKSSEWRAKLYLNKGDLQFEKVTIPDLEQYLSHPETNGIPTFGFFFDYDNDGDKDLFVGFAFGRSHLFENQTDSVDQVKFREVSVPFLKSSHTICLAANALDQNNDGLLDLILTNTLQPHLPDYSSKKELNIFRLPSPEYDGDERMFHFMHESWHNANNGGLNYYLRNNGGQSVFEPVESSEIGLVETRWSLAIGTIDLNNDGYTDIYIANDFGRDDCYLNDKGNAFVRQEGTFFGDLGLDTYKGMNVTAGDLDGNGKEDIYVSNVHHAMQAEGSLLWMNFTNDRDSVVALRERASRFNVLNTNRFGWGAAMGDLNLDGWEDIVQANGMVDDKWDRKFNEAMDYWYFQAQIARTGPEIHSKANNWADIRGCYIYPNEQDRIMINKNGKGFIDLSDELEFNHLGNTRGVALADLDNDGDLDILVTDQFGEPVLYRNNQKDHHWIGITLVGNGMSTTKDAVGSKVWITYKFDNDTVSQYREVRLVNGFSAMGDPRLIFGLGHRDHKISQIRLQVQWHNGEKMEYEVKEWDKYIEIRQ